MKRRIGTYILLTLMVIIGVISYPNVEMFSKGFWLWLVVLLLITILFAKTLLKEKQYELFEYISKENFKNAPVFGILCIPLVISIIALIVKLLIDSVPK